MGELYGVQIIKKKTHKTLTYSWVLSEKLGKSPFVGTKMWWTFSWHSQRCAGCRVQCNYGEIARSLDTNGQESGQAGAGPLAVMKSVPNPVRLKQVN